MDPGHQADLYGSPIGFTLDKIPYTAFGSDGVNRAKVKPTLLSLFPGKPPFESLTKNNSVRSFSGNEQESRAVVAIRGAREFELGDGSALSLSSLLALACVQEQADVQTPLKTLGLIDSVGYQSSSMPYLYPYIIAACKEHCLHGVGDFVDFKSIHTYQWNGASSTSDNGSSSTSDAKSNGSVLPFRVSVSAVESRRSALPSRASALDAPPLSPTSPLRGLRSYRTTEGRLRPRPDRTTAARLRARAVRNMVSRRPARHGPRPRSSPFKGVTHYKRTGRWEAHIWVNRKQIYLGASSTAERAAKAYDRAAIYFEESDADLNFGLTEYGWELQQLMELSQAQLVRMLRKQSAGKGTLYPEYPPITQVQEPPRNTGASKGKRVDQVEPIPPTNWQLDSELVPNRIEADGSCSSFVRGMVQSHQPQGATFHIPQAAHVSQRSRQYMQIIDDMTADLQNRRSG